ncbi:hypothetical protein HAX54_005866, partial [Datura stramonium]|nr:hypothetical protein [Datura stramonium]
MSSQNNDGSRLVPPTSNGFHSRFLITGTSERLSGCCTSYDRPDPNGSYRTSRQPYWEAGSCGTPGLMMEIPLEVTSMAMFCGFGHFLRSVERLGMCVGNAHRQEGKWRRRDVVE